MELHTDHVTGCRQREDQWTLVCPADGATVSLDGQSFRLAAGEVLPVPPEVYCDTAAPCLFFTCSSPAASLLDRQIFPGEPQLLAAIRTELTQQPLGWQAMAGHLLGQLLIGCLRHGGTDCRQRPVSTPQHSWLAHQAVAYLEANFRRRITLDTLASHLDIGTTLLKQVFKAQTGVTVVTYLTKLRMDEAKRLLLAGELSVTQIAEAVGYDNIYYFSNQFKKHTGMTPTAFGKQPP